MDFKRLDGETEDELLARIVNQKDKLGLTWDNIADILNEILDKNVGESAYRKRYKRHFSEEDNYKNYNEDNILNSEESRIKQERLKYQKISLTYYICHIYSYPSLNI